jgi:hypothetical protein
MGTDRVQNLHIELSALLLQETAILDEIEAILRNRSRTTAACESNRNRGRDNVVKVEGNHARKDQNGSSHD